jgi:hypothetical protein
MKSGSASGVPARPDNPFAALVPPDPLMAGMWLSALLWTIRQEGAVWAFQEETDTFFDGREGFALAFVRWFTKEIWPAAQVEVAHA